MHEAVANPVTNSSVDVNCDGFCQERSVVDRVGKILEAKVANLHSVSLIMPSSQFVGQR